MFSGFALQASWQQHFILFYFYGNSKIMTVEQFFRGFLRAVFPEQLFLPRVTSHEKTIGICQF